MGCGASKDSHGTVITTTTPLKPPTQAALSKQASAAPNSISAVVAAKNNTIATATAKADATPPTIQKSASIAPSETGTVQNQSRAPMVKDVKQVSAVGVVAVSSSFVEHQAAIPIVECVAAVVEGSVAAAAAVIVTESRQKSELVEENMRSVSVIDAPVIAAFGDDGAEVPHEGMVYQGSGAGDSFSPGAEITDGEAIEYEILPPGQLPPGMNPEDVPKSYLPEEVEKMLKQEEEERRLEAEQKELQKQKKLMGPTESEIEAVLDDIIPIKSSMKNIAEEASQEKAADMEKTASKVVMDNELAFERQVSNVGATVEKQISNFGDNIEKQVSSVGAIVEKQISTLGAAVENDISNVGATEEKQISSVEATVEKQISSVGAIVEKQASTVAAALEKQTSTVAAAATLDKQPSTMETSAEPPSESPSKSHNSDPLISEKHHSDSGLAMDPPTEPINAIY